MGKYSPVASLKPPTRHVEASSATINFWVGEAAISTEELVEQVTAANPPPVDYAPLLYTVLAVFVVSVVLVLYNPSPIRKKK